MIHWPEEAIDDRLQQWETADPLTKIAGPPAAPDDLTATLKRMRRLAAHNYPSKKDVTDGD